MKRSTFYYWLSEITLFLAVAGFTWRLYGDLPMGLWAAIAVGNTLHRIETWVSRRAPVIGIRRVVPHSRLQPGDKGE